MLAADVDQGQKISKASVGLLLRHPFFGSLLYCHEVLITASVETAAVTTDRVILLNPEFVEKCTAPQLEFLLAHEVMHIVFAHIARRGDRDPVIYNIACDAVINETLIAEGVGEFIAGGIRMLGAQYRTSESIYDEIASRLKPKEKTSPSVGQGLTLPLFPDDLEADGQAGGLAGASDDGSENGNDSSASTSPFIGELNIPDLPREARKMTQEEINEQIEEGKLALGQALTTARTCGNMSGGLARFIGSILESSMPWYELLERYMVSKAEQRYNWSRPDKRRLNIAYLPRRERFPSLGTVVIGVDVSGSISDIEIAEYLGHCERIFDLCHPRKVYVVYCTTQVEAVDEYEKGEPLEPRKNLWSGGTCMPAIMDWIAEELDAIVEYLPISFADELSPETGRANRMMCLALKARTLLYKASPLFNNENNKEWWLDAVRANGEVLLRAQEWGIGLDRYSKIWGPRNGDGIEMIWAIKRGTSNYWESYNYPIGVENANGGMCPTQTLVDNYEYNDGSNQTFGERHSNTVINLTQEDPYVGLDPRFFMTVVKNGDIWPNYNPNPIETFIGGLNAAPIHNSTPTGYYLRKYCDPNVSLATNNPTTSPHAWVVMRLGEFYLNYAEAMFQYYGDAEAKGEGGFSANDAINLLRDRADVMMPHWNGTPANWFERYKRERMVEMAFEDQRFWDVRRWKCGSELSEISIAELQKNASGDIILTRKQEQRRWEDKYYLFPIPFSEYNKNKYLGQNPGWN